MWIKRMSIAALFFCAALATFAETSSTVVKSLAMSEVPADRVAARLTEQTSATVVARGKVSGQRVGAIFVREGQLETVLDQIVAQKPNWLWYAPPEKPGTYEIWDQESFRSEVLPKQTRQRIFQVQEITAEEAYQAVTGCLTPKIGTAAFDPRTNKLIVTDLPAVHEMIERLLVEIDVKLDMQVFKLKNADPAFIGEVLAELKSPAAPDPIVDPRTKQVIVFDQKRIIERMDAVVKLLDI